MRMTGAVARTWENFVEAMRRAAPADMDADDLAESLEAHLESRTEALGEVDAGAMERIIGEIRADLLEEFGLPEARAASPDPDWRLFGLFLASLFAIPFIGPVLLPIAWILSRFKMTRPHHAMDTLPSILCAAAVLVGAPLLFGYAAARMFAELVHAPVGTYVAVEIAVTLALLALLIGLRAWRPRWFRIIFAPLDAAIVERPARLFAIGAGLLGLAAVAAAVVMAITMP